MLQCLTCSKPLTGRQLKYCCRSCKNTNSNFKYQSYESQQKRGFNNKLKLLHMKDCKCENCGYNKNYSALCFHHLRDKQFPLDIRNCSNRNWESLLEESLKCVVLCHNCHMEIHYPQHTSLPQGRLTRAPI